jgi:hypothetical protein
VEGATRFRGRRPCNATRPPGARSAIDPSTCPPAVWPPPPRGGKSDPSRGRDTRAGDRDDRGGLQGCDDGFAARRRLSRGARQCDTPTSNTRGPDHTTGRSRRGGCSVGRFSGEAACPRRRSGIAFRLDTTVKPWHKREDWLGPSEHRGGHRGSGGSAPGPHLIRRSAQLTRLPPSRPNRGRLWTLPELWTHRTRPQLLGKPAQNAGFPQASTATLFFVYKKTKNTKTRTATTTAVQIYAVSGER